MLPICTVIVNATDRRRDGVLGVTLNEYVYPPSPEISEVNTPLFVVIVKSEARPTVVTDEARHEITHVMALPTRAGLPAEQLSDESVVGI